MADGGGASRAVRKGDSFLSFAKSSRICRAFGDGEVRIIGSSLLPPGKQTRVKGGIYSTPTGQPVMAVFQGKAGNRVLNNIVQDAAKSFLVWPAKALLQTLDRNLYYNATVAFRWERDGVAYQAFADYQQAAGETHSRYAAPQLVGPADAHLQPDSPAIDAGAAQNEVTVDIDGIARPQGAACDIGAYELKVNAM